MHDEGYGFLVVFIHYFVAVEELLFRSVNIVGTDRKRTAQVNEA